MQTSSFAALISLIIIGISGVIRVVNSYQYGSIAVEVRLERSDCRQECNRSEDPLGIRDDGRSCDIFSDCDMRLHVNIDTASVNDSWPGAKAIASWYVIDLPGDTNIVKLNPFKILLARRTDSEYSVDSINEILVSFRTFMEDRNFWTASRPIERFNCLFSQIPANSSESAQWQPPLEQEPMQCHGEIHFARPPAERPALYYRWRIYKTVYNGSDREAAVNIGITTPTPPKDSFVNEIGSAVGTAVGTAIGAALGTGGGVGNTPPFTAGDFDIASTLFGSDSNTTGNSSTGGGEFGMSDGLKNLIINKLITYGIGAALGRR